MRMLIFWLVLLNFQHMYSFAFEQSLLQTLKACFKVRILIFSYMFFELSLKVKSFYTIFKLSNLKWLYFTKSSISVSYNGYVYVTRYTHIFTKKGYNFLKVCSLKSFFLPQNNKKERIRQILIYLHSCFQVFKR